MYVGFEIYGKKLRNFGLHFEIFCEVKSNLKVRFQIQKREEYLKSKNYPGKSLGALNQGIWAIYLSFLENR